MMVKHVVMLMMSLKGLVIMMQVRKLMMVEMSLIQIGMKGLRSLTSIVRKTK